MESTYSTTLQRKLEESETSESAVVALYDTHEEAEKAVRKLQKSGCDMQKLSALHRNL